MKNSVLAQNVSDALWFLVLGSCIGWYLQYLWKRRYLYSAAWQRPGPLSFPFIGNALLLVASPSDLLKNLLRLNKLYKSPFPFWTGPKLLFSISEPKDLETVLNSPNALNKIEFHKSRKIVSGQGLFAAPVPIWKRHRKIILPTMNQKVLNDFVPIFVEQSDILLQQLLEEVGKDEFDIFDYVSKCVLDNLCATMMGVSVNAQITDSEFPKWNNKIVEISYIRMLNIWYHFDFIFNLSSHSRQYNDLTRKISTFVDDMVLQKRREYRAHRENAFVDEEFSKRKSFLHLLIELSENGTEFNNEELRDEVITFLIAGNDTSATMLSFFFIVLGMYPEIQQKLYEEVINVLGSNRPVEHADLNKFEYMDRLIRETLRIFPSVPFLGRSVTEDIKLEDCTLPAGCSVLINVIGLHRDPSLYPEPLKFDPDRFLKEEVAKRHPYSWLPFSGGPRNCIGTKFGFMSMKTMIASVVRKFKFSSRYKRIEDIDLKMKLLLQPVDGFKVSIALRK
ncbi:hypothetical protein FQR65_LT11318 [Abscondita terminalis]|nr:hypothetical protein FQR65_LT11318 [Abscondita terminalis]